MTIPRVHKDVTLLREKGDIAILTVRKDVTFLREKAHVYIEGT